MKAFDPEPDISETEEYQKLLTRLILIERDIGLRESIEEHRFMSLAAVDLLHMMLRAEQFEMAEVCIGYLESRIGRKRLNELSEIRPKAFNAKTSKYSR